VHAADPLDPETYRLFSEWVQRREKREPLQYITGVQEFRALDFIVTPDVLIPRPETELVVEAALSVVDRARRTAGHDETPTIIDLCTGSGCIAISLARDLPAARIFASDASEQALTVARQNARKHSCSGRIRFLQGDLLEPFEQLDLRGQIDVITANPPYIRTGDLPSLQPEVREFEPKIALTAGPDGSEIQQRIISQAPQFLRKHGALIMEMGDGQSEKIAGIIKKHGDFGTAEILKDLAGIDRVIVAKRI
jgi:release factor glutamine methyltransferase